MSLVIALVLIAGFPPTAFANNNYLQVTPSREIVHIDWAGNQVATVGVNSLLGNRVLVPGDLIYRTIDIVNSGSSSASLKVGITNNNPLANSEFVQSLNLIWRLAAPTGAATESHTAPEHRITFGELAFANGVLFDNFAAVPGQTNTLKLGIELPDSVTETFLTSVGAFAFNVVISLTDLTPDPTLPPLAPPVNGGGGGSGGSGPAGGQGTGNGFGGGNGAGAHPSDNADQGTSSDGDRLGGTGLYPAPGYDSGSGYGGEPGNGGADSESANADPDGDAGAGYSPRAPSGSGTLTLTGIGLRQVALLGGGLITVMFAAILLRSNYKNTTPNRKET